MWRTLRRTFLATRVLLVALSAVSSFGVFQHHPIDAHDANTTRERSERLATKKVSLSEGMWLKSHFFSPAARTLPGPSPSEARHFTCDHRPPKGMAFCSGSFCFWSRTNTTHTSLFCQARTCAETAESAKAKQCSPRSILHPLRHVIAAFAPLGAALVGLMSLTPTKAPAKATSKGGDDGKDKADAKRLARCGKCANCKSTVSGAARSVLRCRAMPARARAVPEQRARRTCRRRSALCLWALRRRPRRSDRASRLQ